MKCRTRDETVTISLRMDPAHTSDEKLSSLSIIVPAYNEEESLARVVSDCVCVGRSIARKLEVIIVNDGSTDGTGEVAKRLMAEFPEVRVIEHGRNRGFGAAQKTGFRNARYDFVTLVPADNQFDVRELRKYLPHIAHSDMVLGYRVKRFDRLHRRINTRLFRLTLRLLFGVKLRDVNWVKLFRRRVIDGLELFSDGIGVDAEMVVKALRKGCVVAEVPVTYRPRTTGVSTGDRPKNVIRTLVDLLILYRDIYFLERRKYQVRKWNFLM